MLTNEGGEGNCIHAAEISQLLESVINNQNFTSKESFLKTVNSKKQFATFLHHIPVGFILGITDIVGFFFEELD